MRDRSNFDDVVNGTNGAGKSQPDLKTSSLSVFQQAWWIDTASRQFRCVTISAGEGGAELGSLTYVMHRNKIGAMLELAPFWSHLGGPVLRPGTESK